VIIVQGEHVDAGLAVSVQAGSVDADLVVSARASWCVQTDRMRA
jgi:hypothetical protein